MTQNRAKQFSRYVSLNILGMLGLSGNILADTFFVSDRLGADGLAALNLAIAVFGFLNGIGMMLGVGGAARCSICRARNMETEARRTFTLAATWGIFCGLLLAGLGFFFSDSLARFLGADPCLLESCSVYLRTVLAFSPFFIINHIFIVFVRNDGSPRTAMTAMLAGSLSNIFLDWLFMYPLHMGIYGAALATGLAPVIGTAVSSFYMLRNRGRFRLTRFALCPRLLADMAGLGGFAFINEFSSGVILGVFNLLVLRHGGTTGVAAYGIVANLALVTMAVFTGISQGIQPLLSQFLGTGERPAVSEIQHRGATLAAFLGAAAALSALLFSPRLAGIFNSAGDAALQTMAARGIRLYFIGFLFAGINLLTASLLSVSGCQKASLCLSSFRGAAGILPLAVLMAELFGLDGIWLAFPLTEGLSLLFGKFLFRKHLPACRAVPVRRRVRLSLLFRSQQNL